MKRMKRMKTVFACLLACLLACFSTSNAYQNYCMSNCKEDKVFVLDQEYKGHEIERVSSPAEIKSLAEMVGTILNCYMKKEGERIFTESVDNFVKGTFLEKYWEGYKQYKKYNKDTDNFDKCRKGTYGKI